MEGGIEELKQHPFFVGTDWFGLMQGSCKPPYLPPVESPEDFGQIDEDFLNENLEKTEVPGDSHPKLGGLSAAESLHASETMIPDFDFTNPKIIKEE